MPKKIILTILVLLFAFLICSSVSAANGTTKQINLNTSGGQPNGNVLNPVISPDGNYIVYSSDANNLVTNDTNGKSDIFVFNNYNNQTSRISVNSANGQSNGNSYNPSINSNGRYIAFDSVADNLVPLDTNRCSDIFIRDMWTGTITRIGFNSTVLQLNGNSYNPSISGDGRYIAYEFYNAVLGGSYGNSSIYLYDRIFGNTTIVSSGSDSTNPCISTIGNYVAYDSYVNKVVYPDKNNIRDIIRYSIVDGAKITVSVDSYGKDADGSSYNPSINSDGTIIAFQSNANNLCPGDTAGNSDVFVHNTKTGITSRVSVSSSNQQANGASVNPSINADGLYVIFYSFASNLVNGDTNGVSDIFMHDMITGNTKRISVDSMVNQISEGTGMPNISSNGIYAVFLLEPSIDSGYTKVLFHDCRNINPSFTINQIKAAATTVRANIENGQKLPDKVTIAGIDVTMPQFLEILTRALLHINQGNNDTIPLFSFSAPTSPIDNIHTGNIQKTEYLKIANDIKNYMDNSGKTPDFAYKTSLGTYMGFQNLVYMYSMILDYYNTSGKNAAYATMKPWSKI